MRWLPDQEQAEVATADQPSKLDVLAKRMDEIEGKIQARIDTRLEALEASLVQRVSNLETMLREVLGRLAGKHSPWLW